MKEQKNNILEKIMVPFIEPLIKEIDNFDYKYYSSFENKIKSDIENKFDDIDLKETGKLLLDFLKSTDFKKLFETIKIEIDKKHEEILKEDKRSLQILKLIEKADKILPNVSFLILTRIDPIEHIRKMFEPVDLIEEIDKYQGEHRARLVVRLFREVSEILYDNYVKILWELTGVIKKKKTIKSTGNFGVLIDGLNQRLIKEEKIDLIEEDAGWIRNSSSHAKYIYKVENDSLIMWDRNKPKKEIKVKDLLEKAISMYQISSKVIFDIYIYNIYKIILNTELIEFIINEKDGILKADIETLTKLENYFTKQFEQLNKIKIERE